MNEWLRVHVCKNACETPPPLFFLKRGLRFHYNCLLTRCIFSGLAVPLICKYAAFFMKIAVDKLKTKMQTHELGLKLIKLLWFLYDC